MGTLRGYLLLLVAVVKASEDLSHMLQREVSLVELLDMNPEYLEQKLVSSDGMKMHETVQSGRPRVGPRSMGPHIPFPPARPTRGNLQAICRDGNRRPRYPKDTLPSTGFGFLQRRAEAVNQLESWFAECCSGSTKDEQLTLCCVTQAWEESLSAFCDSEFMVKTSHYQCCKKGESEKWQCFEKNAPDESYQASGQQLWTNIPAPNFNFNPSTCQKTGSVINPRTIREKGIPDISFPLGRPTSANIGFICANQRRRPRYVSKCLPSSGYAWLARQSKAINGLERSLSQCCKRKKDEQACAEKEWRKMVDKFCKDEKKAKANQFDCCKKEKGDEVYDCFAAAAPNPDYILEDDSAAPSQARPTLDMLCNKENVTLQTKSLLDAAFVADQCCPMVEEKRPACFQMELHKLQNQLCNDDRNVLGCCLKKDKSRTKCFTKMLLQNIPDTIRISRTKKCPISS